MFRFLKWQAILRVKIFRFVAFLRYYTYPGYLWAKEIHSLLPALIPNSSVILDAPCGDGIISYWLIKYHIKSNSFELYDISKKAIEKARHLIISQDTKIAKNIKICRQDVFQIESKNKSEDTWLLINSLYCLPNIDELIDKFYDRIKFIIGIFPYIDHKNHKCFFRQFPNFKNISEMNDVGTINFFKKHNYNLIEKKDITFISYFCFRNKYIFRIVSPILNIVDKFAHKQKGSYWIGVFERNE